jgi:hypothetical protein
VEEEAAPPHAGGWDARGELGKYMGDFLKKKNLECNLKS